MFVRLYTWGYCFRFPRGRDEGIYSNLETVSSNLHRSGMPGTHYAIQLRNSLARHNEKIYILSDGQDDKTTKIEFD